MRFSKYLEDLLSARADVKMLRTLIAYPTKEFNESELARVSRVGQKTVNRSMPKYADYGIVSARTIGRANVYTLNSGHYIVEQLRRLFEAERRAKAELEQALKASFEGDGSLVSLMIFGSLARGEEKPTSDIDVFVITRDKESAEKRLMAVEEVTIKKFGNVISGYILSPAEFKLKRGSQTVKEISAHGELILGRHPGKVE